MTSAHSDISANLMQELYFQSLQTLDLITPLGQVPFNIQQRKNGFRPAQRCLTLLAAQAQRCQRLTDWTMVQRVDPRLQHWLGDRKAPHPSTLSRTLAAADRRTVKVLRENVLAPLTDQAFLFTEALGRWIFVDVDNKTLPAEGDTYEGTATGRMSDGGYCRGYRLHLISIDNRWPLEMELTGANAHAVPSAMVMFRRLMRRLDRVRRWKIVVRGDSNHGCVQFIRFVHRYDAGYLLKSYNSTTARNLWKQYPDRLQQRIRRDQKADLLAINLTDVTIHGMTRKTLPNGKERRKACQVVVPRVVVYHEDVAQLPEGKKPECFALLTTLPTTAFNPTELLEQTYQPRAGDIENIFCQLDQAFEITHLRSRSFWGNWTYMMLCLIATTLTQMIRQQAQTQNLPIPPGLQETLQATANSGLRLGHDPQTGAVLMVGITNEFTVTFQKALRCSYQHRFRYAA